MMKLFRSIVLGVSIAILPACAVFGPADSGIKVDQTLPPIAQKAAVAINEANLWITAIANVTLINFNDGILTENEKKAMGVKLKNFAKQVDDANVLFKLGDFAQAKSQAELLNKLLVVLHKEVAAKSRVK